MYDFRSTYQDEGLGLARKKKRCVARSPSKGDDYPIIAESYADSVLVMDWVNRGTTRLDR